jgi:phage protein U
MAGYDTPSLYNPVVQSGVLSILYQWGPLQFMVQPLNIHETDHNTATSWAKKEVVGAAIYREWTGEGDETIHVRGHLYPYRIGGMTEIEVLEALRRDGSANSLIRGDGQILGWFVCETLSREHTWLSYEGVGQQIAFEAVFARVPIPANDQYLSQMWNSVIAPF